MRRPEPLPVEAFEVIDRDQLTRKQIAMHALWETLHRLAWNLCIDPGPRVLDKLIILHELTNPVYRRDPIGGAVCLEQVIAFNAGVATYERYLGPATTELLKYAAACGRKRVGQSDEGSEAEDGTGGPSGDGASAETTCQSIETADTARTTAGAVG